MNCENCGKNKANVKYTQIINGEKKQMFLCEECSEKLGINNIHFNMPISFNSFLTDFFTEAQDYNLVRKIGNISNLECKKCGLNWNDFLHTGNFGCSNCYEDFSSNIEPILRSLQGATSHIGRLGEVKIGNDIETNLDDKVGSEEEKNIIEQLKEELKQAIKEERYEDAAELRDKIKQREEK